MGIAPDNIFYGHIRVLEYQVLKQKPHATVTQYQVTHHQAIFKPTRLEILTLHLGFMHSWNSAIVTHLLRKVAKKCFVFTNS